MAQNRRKVTEKPRGQSKLQQRLRSLPGMDALRRGFTIEQVPRLLFLVFLGILYIANSHAADRSYRRLSKLRALVEELRVDYTTLQADYMFSAKQSEVARRVESIGLIESNRPPRKVVVKPEE
ncbi:MAG: FtsL-like putative cell division protein [Catalinimonas sp.]